MPKIKDLTGQRFGKLLVIERAPNEGKLVAWFCQCDCGSLLPSTTQQLGGGRKSCALCKKPGMPIKDLTGQRFGRLVVLRDTGKRRRKGVVWWCRCDCGVEKEIWGPPLRNGSTQSCGCFHWEHCTTHGDSGSPEHRCWKHINDRCYNPNNPAWKNYGGRGIIVCTRWRTSYTNFLTDMGRKPTPKYTIERINNDGPYSPENSRWATRTEQARNTRRNLWLTYEGETLCIEDWARRLGKPHEELRLRFHQKGLNPHQVLFGTKH